MSNDKILQQALAKSDGLTQCFVVSESEIICSNTSTGNTFLNLSQDVGLTPLEDIDIKGEVCSLQMFSDTKKPDSSGFKFGILTSKKDDDTCTPTVYSALKDFDRYTVF